MNNLLLSFLGKKKATLVFTSLLFITLFFVGLVTNTAYSQAFRTTWVTDDGFVEIPTRGTGYNYTVTWTNLTNTGVGNGSATAQTGDYTITGLENNSTYEIAISGDFPRFYMNDVFQNKTKLLTIEEWGNINWQTMERAFWGCHNLTYNATDIPDLSSVTSLSAMFDDCRSFEGNATMNNWNTSTITDMSKLFRENYVFNQDISNWNTQNVTNFSFIFSQATLFNQNISSWVTSSATRMDYMFHAAANFNQPIGNWDVSNVTAMGDMFRQATVFDQDIGDWNTESVTGLSRTFELAEAFNQDISRWNTDRMVNMSGTFSNATSFNQDIGGWNMANVRDMSDMFYGATSFNQDISSWNTGEVTAMLSMFNGAIVFNQDISSWNTSNVTTMRRMFYGASNFDQNLGRWNVTSIRELNGAYYAGMLYMFDYSNLSITNLDATIIGWAAQNVQNDVSISAVGLTHCAAEDAIKFLDTDKNWNFVSFTYSCSSFRTKWVTTDGTITIPTNGTGYNYSIRWLNLTNPGVNEGSASNQTGNYTITGLENGSTYDIAIDGDFPHFYMNGNATEASKLKTIESWGSIAWTSMESAFEGCAGLTYSANDIPNLSGVTDMSAMFAGCNAFDGNATMNSWSTDNVTNMRQMFDHNFVFNQDISNWNTENVTNMSSMFSAAYLFNQPLNDWNTSNVTDMNSMFTSAVAFNQPLNNWDVSSVTDMKFLFSGASAFNQLLNNWNTSNVTNMFSTFELAVSFNQSLASWDITGVTQVDFLDGMGAMLNQTALSRANYDATLLGWSIQNVNPNIKLGANGLEYCTAELARNTLTSGTNNWIITGDNLTCSAIPFITTWVTDDATITIPTNGTGYNYTVAWTNLTNPTVGDGSVTAQTNSYIITGLENGSTYEVSIFGQFPHFYINNNPAHREKIRSIEQWGNIEWTSMLAAFYGSENLTYNATDNPDLSNVTSMSFMFAECDIFEGNSTINSWNTDNVTNMSGLFTRTLYNSPLDNWNTENVTNMFAMFSHNLVFNQPIGNWDVGNVTNFESMFGFATSFNQPLNDWNTQSATRMISTFAVSAYNQPLYNWNLQNVTRMDNMFASNSVFNQNINMWDVSNVTTMSEVFYRASSFNQPLSNWNTSSVTNMQYMFNDATAFNKDLSNWNTELVVTMGHMFDGATSFNQSLASWNVERVVQNPLNVNGGMIDMLSNSGIDISNYDATLISWAAQNLNSDIQLGATGLQYCSAQTERTTLTSAPNNWIITGDTFETNCSASNDILPSTQMAKLLANGTGTYHAFGHTVDISGDYAIVGAYGDATGSQNTREAAYIFKRVGVNWIQEVRLTGRDETREEQFGYSVSISGDYAVVGAYADDRNGELTGVAYVFKRNGTNWTQHAILETDTPQTRVLFGWSVSISEDYIAVGASQENGNSISSSGVVYIFKNVGSTWTQEAKLIATDAEASDEMGRAVSMFGDYVVAGAFGEDTGGSQAGAAYIFKRDGTTWTQQAKLQPNDLQSNDHFGYAVSMTNGYALVGTDNRNGAYVFKQDGTNWTQQAKLVTNDMDAFKFGSSVAISNERAVVGAHRTTTANGMTGAAYLFKRDGEVWTEQQTFLGRNLAINDEFGASVAIEGSYALVGAYGDDGSDVDAGAVYVFSYPEINLQGNNINIADGATSPNVSDSTDFGAVRTNQTVQYTIQNTGQSGLKISSITLSGANASEFVVSNFINNTIINSQESIIFDVRCTPTSLGVKTATVAINSEDADESMYDFVIQATGVSTNLLFVKANGGDDTNTGADFDNAFATVEKALSLSSLGTQIYVAKGTYIPTQEFDFDASGGTDPREVVFTVPDGVEIYGGFEGTETGAITQTMLEARDFALNETILSADLNGDDVITGAYPNVVYSNYAENAYHIVRTENVSNLTRIDGFTITGGNANGTFSNGSGAGFYNYGKGNGNRSKPVLSNLVISKNIAAVGASLFNNGGTEGDASPTLRRCQFFQNKATSAGGGIFNDGSNSGNSSPIIDNCYFSQNIATFYGGAIENFGYNGISNPIITNTYFYKNKAERGGGIYNEGEDGQSNATVTNCIFMDNTAMQSGGGIHNNGRTGIANATITNCTFFKNKVQVGAGAGIYSDGTTGESNSTITNSAFWENEGASSRNSFYNLYANTTISYSSVQEVDANGITSLMFSITTIGDGMMYGQDPLFVDEANWNLDIQACSPLVNQGDNGAINNLGVDSDITGRMRIITSTIDIGAVEFDPNFNPQINVKGNGVDIADNDLTPSLTDNTDFGNVPGQRTITYTIQNTGTTFLTISSIEVTGTNASDFVVNGFTGNTAILEGNTLTFDVTYTPVVVGTSTAMITINNGDCSQAEYNFAIKGNNNFAPDINVQGNSIDIANNDITPSTTDDTDFGDVLLCNTNTITKTFTIQNTGVGNLVINNITVTGTDAADFALSTFTSTVAPFSSTTFTVTFGTSRAGTHTATIEIETNDSDESPYTFGIQAVGIADIINPIIPTLADETAQCEVTALAPPTTTDNCAGTITGTTAQTFPITTLGTTVVEWTFDDGNGNIVTANQNVIITADTQDPVIPTLADETVQCEVTALTPPTTTDNCAGTITGTTTQIFPITTQGTTVVEWTFDDGNGNVVTANQNVIITADTQTPIIPTLADETAQCEVTALTPPTTTDNCAGIITGTTTQTFPITAQGTTVVEWTFDDGNGNVVTANQNVIITADTQTPIIPTLADETAQCEVTALTPPTTTDNCAGIITGTTTQTFPITAQGTTVVEWTFDDGNGNVVTANQNIMITDTEVPTITVPANVTANTDTGICTASNLILGTATGTDNCGIPTFTNDAPIIFPVGLTNVTWTADDGHGNTVTAIQTVTITTPVEINVTGNNISITDGSTTPNLNDNTDFGDVTDNRTVTYIIENTGTQPLLISSITSDNTDFVVSTIPSSILAGSTSTFDVTFSSTTLGLSSASITVNNNDCDEASYDFAIQATKVSATPPPPPNGGTANPGVLTGRSNLDAFNRLNLSWNTNNNVSAFRLYRNGVLIGTFSGSIVDFADADLAFNTFYRYELIAVINGADSNPSVFTFWTAPDVPTVESVTQVCEEGRASVTFSQTQNSLGNTYRIYSEEQGGNIISQSNTPTFNLPFVSSQTDFYVSEVGAQNAKEGKRAQVTVTIQPIFEANILGESTQNSCTNSLTLQAEEIENATSYTWILNNNEVGTGQTFTATTAGNYQIRIQKGVCEVTSSLTRVLLNQIPTAQIRQSNAQNTVTFCENGMLNATVQTGDVTYSWVLNGNIIEESQNVTVSQSGTYTLLVSKNGCQASTEINVVIAPRPQLPTLAATQISLCQNDNTTLSIQNIENGMSYKWFRNGRAINQTGTSIETNTAGKYTVEATSNLENSCKTISQELQINRFETEVTYLRENREEQMLFVESANAQNQITNVEWYFEGNVASNLGSDIQITPTEQGNYSAIVTNQNGCIFQTRVVYFSPKIITGEEDLKVGTFKIYPNPSNGIFKVQFETALSENTEVTIFDGIGRKIHTQTFEKGNQEFLIDVKNQSKGMYLIHFNQNDKVYSKQIIIE